MDNKIQIFDFQSQEVRVVTDEENNPWWVLKDVCNVLELTDTNKVAERLDTDELTRIKLVSGGQNREMYIVNESGLYNVIIRSDKPEAKKFKRWITHEVIPSIRKTGSYSIQAKGTDALIAQAEMLLSSMKQMKELEEKQAEQEMRLLEVESAIADLPDPHYKTVVGYANEHYISVPLNAARVYGKMCTQYSKALGYPIENVPHPLYGTVHAYHEDILRRVVR